MQRIAMIGSPPKPFGMVRAMQTDHPDWRTGCWQVVREAPAGIIRDRMAEDFDCRLGNPGGCGGCDRRNGIYRRRLPCESGDIELALPRIHRYCLTAVLGSHARRAPEIDRVIPTGFVLGLSTRRIGEVLLLLLGRPVSHATANRVAGTLDADPSPTAARPSRSMA